MDSAPAGRAYVAIAALWFVAAFALGASGRLARLHPPAPQLILAGLTILLIGCGVVFSGFRRWIATLDTRSVLVIHLTRFVGAYFLLLNRRGELPYAFAVPGGWGDILVASLALLILVRVPEPEQRPHVLMGWNLLGLVDLLLVVGTAARLAMADPGSMQALLRLPLSLLPTFLVPLLIASHVLLFWRMRREART
jgi:hypothetical protein